MRFMKRIVMLLFLSVMVCTLSAQEKKGETIGERIVANAYNADSIRGILDKMPYFTLFKDNYFVGGTTLGHKPTAANSDVKFQLSIAQRLTKANCRSILICLSSTLRRLFGMSFRNRCP